MIVTTGSLALVEWLAVRDPEEPAGRGPRHARGPGALVAMLLLLLILVLAVVTPGVGMFWLFLLFLSGPLTRLAGRRRRSHEPDGDGGADEGG